MIKRKYRICIETEKSGTKWYSAQESHLLGFWWSFNTLTSEGYSRNTSIYNVEVFPTIGEAESAINKRLENIKVDDSEKIISVEYKYIP